MGYKTVSTFYARKPLRAEHPLRSGTIVEYKPGDVIPAGEWGASANWLVENGRAAEMFDNVWVDEEGASGPPPDTQVRPPKLFGPTVRSQEPAAVVEKTEPLYDESAPAEEFAYPLHEGAGWYTLSDGSRVRGKEAAVEAENAISGGSDV